MPIRGKYQARVADNAEDPAKALTAFAHLLHEDAFDPVPASELGIGASRYEARWSESCDLCGAIWIGTKAGEVLCIDLGNPMPRVLSLALDRGVRTLLHLHGPNAFGPDHTLLVGTDDGFLRRLHEVRGQLVEAEASWHVESWWAAAGAFGPPSRVAPGHSARVIRATESIARTDDDRYTVGVTAMARLRKDASGASPILITTRRGAIFLLEAEPGPGFEPAQIRLRWLHTMTGWVQWILTIPNSDRIACISRGGELIRIFTADPTVAIKTERLPLLPTAAAPFLEGFMLGTSEGLMYWSEQDQHGSLDGDHRQRVVSLPITRSPVLIARCLGEGGYGRVYIADPGHESTRLAAVKIFRHIHDPEGTKSDHFLASARRNRELSGATGTRGAWSTERATRCSSSSPISRWRTRRAAL